jgi:hypothetical protein
MPLRLQLSPTPYSGALSGSWWPSSRDLQPELANLIDHFPAEVGHVSRGIFSRPDWDTVPRKVSVGRGLVKTGSFPRDDTHLMVLTLSTGRRLSLLVVPHDTEEEAARNLMARASDPANTRSAGQLLAREREPEQLSS